MWVLIAISPVLVFFAYFAIVGFVSGLRKVQWNLNSVDRAKVWQYVQDRLSGKSTKLPRLSKANLRIYNPDNLPIRKVFVPCPRDTLKLSK
jgi:hypothetical protein